MDAFSCCPKSLLLEQAHRIANQRQIQTHSMEDNALAVGQKMAFKLHQRCKQRMVLF